MPMGYGANYAEVISDTDLAKIVGGDLLVNFSTALDAFGIAEQDFVDSSLGEDDYDEACHNGYHAIVDKFEKETGLGLELQYHDSEEGGSCYDDIDGHYWEVLGMYQLTPAGEKLKDIVVRNFFVTFG